MRTTVKRLRRLAAVCLISAVVLGALHAQDAPAPGDDTGGDPPSRVARLSYMAGDVGFLPSGAKDWSAASVNRPLTRGDRLSTGQDSRAELEIGGGTLRIASQTDFGFLDLTDQVSQVELTQGTLNLSVRALDDGQSYEIDTPTVALVVDRPGTFRIDISADGKASLISVLSGGGTVYGENSAQRTVTAGRSYEFADSALADVTVSELGGGDAFDSWAEQRDQRYAEQSPSSQYVSDDVVGYQDLDANGSWQDDADVGAVWFPSHVGADWAPYRDGHWAWIGPWGWTWVDDSPWGFAPYHYGRWSYVRGAWGWIPGPRFERPVYAPALVAFVGGNHFGVGIGGAPVGWFPLGPRDVYNPWYRASRGYYSRVNVTNINVRNNFNRAAINNSINNNYTYFRNGKEAPGLNYANRSAPRALTAVPANVFTGAGRVSRSMVAVTPAQAAGAQVMTRGTAIRPTAASFAQPRLIDGRALPAGGFSRAVVARRAPSVQADVASRGSVPAAGGRGPQAAAAAQSNVRVLSGHAGGATANAAMPVNRQPAAQQNAGSGPVRPGEFPSSHFARPIGSVESAPGTGRAGPDRGASNAADIRQAPQQVRENNTPRPGVSFVQPAARPERTLPQAQAIEPANDARNDGGRAQFDRPVRTYQGGPIPQPANAGRNNEIRDGNRFDPGQPRQVPRQEPQQRMEQQQQRVEQMPRQMEHAPPAAQRQQQKEAPANNRGGDRGRDDH
jgi:FecR protein